MTRFTTPLALALLAALGGCATITEDNNDQMVEIHIVQNNREIAGVGCTLTNKLGRWFVTAPGRVTIKRYPNPLTVDCGRDGLGRTIQHFEARYDTHALMGNVLATGGLGYMVDRYSGNGFAYPQVITVVMPSPPVAQNMVSGATTNSVF
jgi:hypothetical protein